MTTESNAASATIIYEDRPLHFERAIADSNAVWLDAAELKRLAGWELKPEGICRGDLCVPMPPGRESEFTSKRDGATFLNFGALADLMGKPWAGDSKHRVWYFGAEAAERGDALRTLEAPDFELPDLEGKLHRL
ncbi:MAG TPA: redoxin domain-containing (seleno)protein, partial [Candidatus Acidoferrum sp.]|nr:redoxin domain-containing (seleno)protein [Candidatus Acidoferrum sp.]